MCTCLSPSWQKVVVGKSSLRCDLPNNSRPCADARVTQPPTCTCARGAGAMRESQTDKAGKRGERKGESERECERERERQRKRERPGTES